MSFNYSNNKRKNINLTYENEMEYNPQDERPKNIYGSNRRSTIIESEESGPIFYKYKKSKLPARGQPGGLDDPLRRGLSGAGVRWYLRFLAQGLHPHAARKRAEKRKRPETTEFLSLDGKRTRESYPFTQKYKVQNKYFGNKQNTSSFGRIMPSRSTDASNLIDLKITILPKNYPQENLTLKEQFYLEDAIIDEVASEWPFKLEIDRIKYKIGMMVIECTNEATVKWFIKTIPKLKNWKGVELHTIIGDNIPIIKKQSTNIIKVIKIAILPKNYPNEVLSSKQLSKLEEIIIDEVALGASSKIEFEGIHFKATMLIIDCTNEQTANWLIKVTPKLSGWKGISLQAKLANTIPRNDNVITLFLPRSGGQEPMKSLALIDSQNSDLRIKAWKILRCSNQRNGQELKIEIDEKSKESIIQKGYLLKYRFGTISVTGLKKERYSSQTINKSKYVPSGSKEIVKYSSAIKMNKEKNNYDFEDDEFLVLDEDGESSPLSQNLPL